MGLRFYGAVSVDEGTGVPITIPNDLHDAQIAMLVETAEDRHSTGFAWGADEG